MIFDACRRKKKKKSKLLGFYSLWVQKVHELQQHQCHREVPVVKENTSLSGFSDSKSFLSVITLPCECYWTLYRCIVYEHNGAEYSYSSCALCCCAATHRRSRHSLETRMSTQTLHASLSLVSSNSLLTTRSSRSLH